VTNKHTYYDDKSQSYYTQQYERLISKCFSETQTLKPRSSNDPRVSNRRRWMAQNATILFFSSEFSDQISISF